MRNLEGLFTHFNTLQLVVIPNKVRNLINLFIRLGKC